MPKRFTDVDKWKDEWFLTLSKDEKMIWLYVLDNCTNAGRWKKNFKLLNFCCEVEIDNIKFKEYFNGRVLDYETYFFIPKFLKFQYPKGLNSEKPAIIGVRSELEQYNLCEKVVELYGEEYLSNKKIQEKETIKNIVHTIPEFPVNKLFEEIWKVYPKRTGMKQAFIHFKATIKTLEDFNNIKIALKNYLESERVFNGYIQGGSVWFNNWQDWVNYKETVCNKCKGKGKYLSTTGYEIICDCPKGKK